MLAPLAVGEFMRDYWPYRPYWSTGDLERVCASIREELSDSERVLRGYRSPVWLLRADGFSASVPTGDGALAFYRSGFTCYLPDVAGAMPSLRELADRVAEDVGMPPNCLTCELFCSGADSGVSIHSDHDANFALLLHGEKRWWLAPNTHITNQTGICRPASAPGRDSSQLLLADHLPFPERMPDGAISVDVESGGLMFLPRGWWHRTESRGPSLQLNVVVKGPMWVTVLARALERRLGRDPGWREFAWGIGSGGEERDAAARQFASLLAGLRDELSEDDDLTGLAGELVEEAGLRRRRSTAGAVTGGPGR